MPVCIRVLFLPLCITPCALLWGQTVFSGADYKCDSILNVLYVSITLALAFFFFFPILQLQHWGVCTLTMFHVISCYIGGTVFNWATFRKYYPREKGAVWLPAVWSFFFFVRSAFLSQPPCSMSKPVCKWMTHYKRLASIWFTVKTHKNSHTALVSRYIHPPPPYILKSDLHSSPTQSAATRRVPALRYPSSSRCLH